MSYTNIYLARHIEQAEGGMGLTYTCRDCDVPTQDLMRLIHVTPNPTLGEEIGVDELGDPIIDTQVHVPVFAKVVPCGKQWASPEEYIDYDFQANVFGYHRILSVDLHASWFAALGCFDLDEKQKCIGFTFTYDPGLNKWVSEVVTVLGGTLTFTVWGDFDGISEIWYYEWVGCSSSAFPLSVFPDCFSPLRFSISPDVGWSATDPACCDAPSNVGPTGRIDIWGLNRPVYYGRLVDVLDDGPAFAVAECCNEACDTTFGCCDHVVPDGGTITYTASNVTGLDCASADPPPCIINTFSYDPSDPSIASIEIVCPEGPHPAPNVTVTIQLVCRATEFDTERGWEHYRLAVTVGGGGIIPYTEYVPTSGSCEPFFLVFEGIAWAVQMVDPTPDLCEGTFDVTVLD